MITTPTLIVLGAGASRHLNYPLGRGQVRSPPSLPRRDHSSNTTCCASSALNYSQVTEFYKALSQSGRTSVDAFLEHRPDLVQTGKIAMAIALIRYEDLPFLFHPDNNWYDYLYARMNCPLEKIPAITVSL